MRLTKHTIVACTIALLLAATPLALAAEQPGQITPQSDYTQTVDDNTVSISYVVNTSGNQQLAQSEVNLTRVPSDLDLVSNRTQTVERIAGDEKAIVTYKVRIPADTPTGNYTLHAKLTQEQRVFDSANYTIWVHYGNQQTNSGGSKGSEDVTESEASEGGGGGAFMIEQDCGWTCFDDNIGSWFDDLDLLPDWDFFS